MLTIKVQKKDAEKVRKQLINNDLLLHEFEVASDNCFVYLAISDKKKVKEVLGNYEFVEKMLKSTKKETKLKEILHDKLSKEEMELVRKSFDVIGSIAIIEILDELKEKELIIAETVLKLNKSIKTVLKKQDIHKGEFRTRKLKYLTGDNTKETIHKENNVRIKLDVEQVYFSPRLSTERKRVAELVKGGEEVLVMFSGCAPYPLVIAKNTPVKQVYGVELNPIAHNYGKENVKLNKLKNIDLINGDVKSVVPKLGRKFDRILMPLPKTSEDFLNIAFEVAEKGTIIHFYDFSTEDDFPKHSISKIEKACNDAGIKFNVLHSTKCGAYSPRVHRVCIDFQIR